MTGSDLLPTYAYAGTALVANRFALDRRDASNMPRHKLVNPSYRRMQNNVITKSAYRRKVRQFIPLLPQTLRLQLFDSVLVHNFNLGVRKISDVESTT